MANGAQGDLLEYLGRRRSVPAAQLMPPGPDGATLRRILELAVRVPDHGKLAPWRFLVYGREERQAAEAWLRARADTDPSRFKPAVIDVFVGSPLVVGVVSTASEHPKIPEWEQVLSAGAVCLNLVHAAQASGLAAQWLTGWLAYDPQTCRWLGLRPGERFAGFLHLGTPAAAPAERPRPDVDDLTTVWSPPATG